MHGQERVEGFEVILQVVVGVCWSWVRSRSRSSKFSWKDGATSAQRVCVLSRL